MAEKKNKRVSSHMGGSGREYNGLTNLTAKMTPEMKKRLASKKRKSK